MRWILALGLAVGCSGDGATTDKAGDTGPTTGDDDDTTVGDDDDDGGFDPIGRWHLDQISFTTSSGSTGGLTPPYTYGTYTNDLYYEFLANGSLKEIHEYNYATLTDDTYTATGGVTWELTGPEEVTVLGTDWTTFVCDATSDDFLECTLAGDGDTGSATMSRVLD